MKSFTELLVEKAQESKSIVCMGIDPVVKRIPLKEQSSEKKIVKFFSEIIEAAVSNNSVPVAVKPNYAFFAQNGFSGLRALKKVIVIAKSHKIPVILDAKRGDIGSSSEAYAREAFGFWKADAVTVSPYMGIDSIEPFLRYCSKGKGVYLLVRTSNKGASDFQDLSAEGKKVYMHVAGKLLDSHIEGLGAVAGATSPGELAEISSFFANSGKQVPLLIPGVGTQGGLANEVADVLRRNGSLAMHRINSSSSINYAYEKQQTDDFAGAAIRAIKEINSEIGEI
ncbi:orotidine-5'-phosphate decarboxylase [Candidatus Woesearchaeota archaeon]|nr:orotidine-5'-phosphate decarboxylase [Candidatus Woesearchaeota archaeon]